ncbi:hypothetical protein Ga0466249_004967 [Sporomusaceae bacterium BoRhaA]|nr:hypothetical protein [Pelorhabdus rhamnosifermentans]
MNNKPFRKQAQNEIVLGLLFHSQIKPSVGLVSLMKAEDSVSQKHISY